MGSQGRPLFSSGFVCVYRLGVYDVLSLFSRPQKPVSLFFPPRSSMPVFGRRGGQRAGGDRVDRVRVGAALAAAAAVEAAATLWSLRPRPSLHACL